MNGAQQHMIRRIKVTVNATGENGLSLQSRISRFMNDEALLEKVSTAFDHLVTPEEWLTLNQVDLRLAFENEHDLDVNFLERLIRHVHEQLAGVSARVKRSGHEITAKDKPMSATERTLEALLYFLNEGSLPWWYEVQSHAQFENAILNLLQILNENYDYGSVERHLQEVSAVLQSEWPARRMVSQFSPEIVMAILTFLMRQHRGLKPESIREAYQEIAVIIRKEKANVPVGIWDRLDAWLIRTIARPGGNPKLIIGEWLGEIIYRFYPEDHAVILKSIEKNKVLRQYEPIPVPATLKPVIAKVSTSAEEEPVSDKGREDEPSASDVEEIRREGVVVGNAGLVLLAPFLERFFINEELIDKDSILDKNKAMALMHYLVYGNLDYHEYDLMLEKVLCGVETNEPIELIAKLSDQERSDSEELLEAAIQNWNVLKNTSPDGLREGFLQRKGILTFKGDEWRLRVERNTIDILLDSLPWTIGYVQLPWMKNLLHTDWT